MDRFQDSGGRCDFFGEWHEMGLLNADIEIGHRSTLLVHYAIMSCRAGGEKLEIDQKDGTLLNTPRLVVN